MRTFFYSRLSLSNAPKDDIGKADFLLRGLSNATEIIYRKDSFKFVNAQAVKVLSKTYISAELVKFKKDHEENVVNKANELEVLPINNIVLAKIRFIIDPQLSIIMHEENRSHIPGTSFGLRFKELFETNMPETAVEVAAITDEYDFFNRIAEVKEIKKIVIKLVPSNPNNADLWKDVDERLREDHITNYQEVQENKKKGDSIVLDDETKSKFYMSEDGYGKSVVQGFDSNGKFVQVNSDSAQKHAKANISNEVVVPEEQISLLQNKLSEISKRTNEIE